MLVSVCVSVNLSTCVSVLFLSMCLSVYLSSMYFYPSEQLLFRNTVEAPASRKCRWPRDKAVVAKSCLLPVWRHLMLQIQAFQSLFYFSPTSHLSKPFILHLLEPACLIRGWHSSLVSAQYPDNQLPNSPASCSTEGQRLRFCWAWAEWEGRSKGLRSCSRRSRWGNRSWPLAGGHWLFFCALYVRKCGRRTQSCRRNVPRALEYVRL